MIDYILKFPDKAAAHTALADWRFTDDSGNSGWAPKPKCGIIEIKMILQKAAWDNSNPETPKLISSEVVSSGFWILIAKPGLDEILWAQPFTVSEHDRVLANTNQSHLVRTKLTAEQISEITGISPVFAGSGYPF